MRDLGAMVVEDPESMGYRLTGSLNHDIGEQRFRVSHHMGKAREIGHHPVEDLGCAGFGTRRDKLDLVQGTLLVLSVRDTSPRAGGADFNRTRRRTSDTVADLVEPANPLPLPFQDTSVFKKAAREKKSDSQSELDV